MPPGPPGVSREAELSTYVFLVIFEGFPTFLVLGPILVHQNTKFELSGWFPFSRHPWRPWERQSSGVKLKLANPVTVSLVMTWTDLLELVMESDANGDGTIDLGEFIELMKRKSSETDQMEVSNSFFFKYYKKPRQLLKNLTKHHFMTRL